MNWEYNELGGGGIILCTNAIYMNTIMNNEYYNNIYTRPHAGFASACGRVLFTCDILNLFQHDSVHHAERHELFGHPHTSRSYHLSVGKYVGGISAGTQEFGNRYVHRHMSFLTVVLYALGG